MRRGKVRPSKHVSRLEVGPRTFPQARAQATYDALLAAGERVFSERGFDEAQSPDIAAAAGVSVGTFYRYFVDKRAPFLEMIERHLVVAHEALKAGLDPAMFEGKSHSAAVRRVVDVAFAQVRRSGGIQSVYLGMSLRDPEVARLRAKIDGLVCEELERLIRQIVPRSVISEPRVAAWVIHHAVLDGAMALASGPPSDGLSERGVQRAMCVMVERYLFPNLASSTGSSRRISSGRDSTK